jgi:hypothetical protein
VSENARLDRVHDLLDKIRFHPDLVWSVDRYPGGPQPFGSSPHLAVRFEMAVLEPGPKESVRKRRLFYQQILTAEELDAMRDPQVVQWLLHNHMELWRHLAETWSQPKPGAHLRSVPKEEETR